MHVVKYFLEAVDICSQLPHKKIEELADALAALKGKLYIIGLGGSMANAIHMAADLRKLCDIDAEAFDNIAELTARMNDEGPNTIFVDWVRRMKPTDALFVLSVGGGTDAVSTSIVNCILGVSAPIYGIVGPDGGMTTKYGKIVINIPVTNAKHVTPHTEAFQAMVWHCLISHPKLQKRPTKW